MEINKFTNYMITSQKNHTPPYDWSDSIFQTFKPVSGNFLQGDNFDGNMVCVNNQTGRAYYANPCGYSNNLNDQFNSGYKVNDSNLMYKGALFPTNDLNHKLIVTPGDRVVFGYTRIGEEYRSR